MEGVSVRFLTPSVTAACRRDSSLMEGAKLPPSAACGVRGRGTAQRGKESMSSAVPAVYCGRLIAAPTVSRVRAVEDASPYGLTSAGRPYGLTTHTGGRKARPYAPLLKTKN